VVPEPASPEQWSDDRVALLAHMIGDGSYPTHQPMRYTTGSEENSELVRRAAMDEFGMRVTRYAGRGNWHQLVLAGNGNRWKPAGMNLWLRKLGVYGQRSRAKRVPDAVFRLANRQVGVFLRHLWATDGTISPRRPQAGQRGGHGVHFCTCSRGLAGDVAALLLRLGIVARTQSVISGYRHLIYMVWVHGVEKQTRFLDAVGAFGPRVGPAMALRAALTNVKANTNVDTMPEEMLFRVAELMRLRGMSTGRLAKLRGVRAVRLNHCPSRATMLEYARILGDGYLQRWAQSDVFWDRILNIEPMGSEPVFDLQVPSGSCWLADGIVSHGPMEAPITVGSPAVLNS
jgi:replicative DNA helicase